MSPQKKYLQLHNRIAAAITDGSYSAGDKLPTELELAAKYRISRQTVRTALDALAGEGLIVKIRGSGSYISGIAHAAKKTMRIAVVANTIDTCTFPPILRGIEDVLSRNHYSVQLMVTNGSMAKERDVLQRLSAGGADGVLVEGTKTALPNPNLSFYRAFADRKIPVVFFGGYYPELFDNPDDGVRYVVMDDYGGAFAITNDLIARGHPKEAFGEAAAQQVLSLIGGKKCENLVMAWDGGGSPMQSGSKPHPGEAAAFGIPAGR